MVATSAKTNRWSNTKRAGAFFSLVGAGLPAGVSAKEAAFNQFTGPQATISQIDPIQVDANPDSITGLTADAQAADVVAPSVGALGHTYITIARNNTGSMSDDSYKVGAVMLLLPDDAHALAVHVDRPGIVPEGPEGQRSFTPLEFQEHVMDRVTQLGQQAGAFMQNVEARLGQDGGPSSLVMDRNLGRQPHDGFNTVNRWLQQTLINAERQLDREAMDTLVNSPELAAVRSLQQEVDVELQMYGVMMGGIHHLQWQLDTGRLVPRGSDLPPPNVPDALPPQGEPINFVPGVGTQLPVIEARLQSGPASQHATERRAAVAPQTPTNATVYNHDRRLTA